MTKFYFIILSFFFCIIVEANSIDDSLSISTKNVIWFTPSDINVINGVAIGIVESSYFNKNQVVNGLGVNILSMGYLFPAFVGSLPYDPISSYRSSDYKVDSLLNLEYRPDRGLAKCINNGLVISPLGYVSHRVNGFVISGGGLLLYELNGMYLNAWINMVTYMRGVCIGFINSSQDFRGIQIGVFNNTLILKGIQFGVWNVNVKRSLPFINWNF